ncbi:MAG: leucine-rich repeat domain-containing protein [Muribaculaceae bacterium]|nr:leucine-rich repeat domain-containing protein [Muribaculaceae bacterium]
MTPALIIKAINPSAFTLCISLGKINIPSGCIEIGTQAFSSCTSLTKVDFPYISHQIGLTLISYKN